MYSPYQDEKYIDVRKNEKIIDKLNTAIDLMNNNGCWQRYVIEKNIIKNVLTGLDFKEPFFMINNSIYLHPVIVGLVDPDVTKLNPLITNISDCPLCDYYNFIFDPNNNLHRIQDPSRKEEKRLENNITVEKYKIIMNNKVPPNLTKTLKWKNYIIVPNYEPYFKNHFMIMSLNHNVNKIVGSQFDILDFTVLKELLEFYKLNNEELSFLHNYAHTGSQAHLHIHFTLTDKSLYSFYDQLSNSIADNYFKVMILDRNNFKVSNFNPNLHISNFSSMILSLKYPNLPGIKLEKQNANVLLNVELFATLDKEIFLCKHSETEYGTNGFLISTRKSWVNQNDQNFNKFITVVNGFLNSIELSLTHSFCQFWTKSDNYLNIYVVTQIRDVNMTSARALRMDITTNRRVDSRDYGLEISNLVNYNNQYLNTEFFNIDIVDNAFKENILQIKNPITSGFKYEVDFNLLRTHTLFIYPFIESVLSQKKSVSDPFVFLSIGPAGAGKSRIIKNKELLDKFNINLDDCLIVNVDDIRLNMPMYKNATEKIKVILKQYETMNLSSLGIKLSDPIKFGSIKLNDIIYNRVPDLIKEMTFNDLENIYLKLFYTAEPSLGRSLYGYHLHVFNVCHGLAVMVYDHMIKEGIKRKINILLETVGRDYDMIFKENGIEKFVGYKKYLIMVLVDDSEESKKYVLRNLIQRSFMEGRIIDLDDTISRIEDNYQYNFSYKLNLNEFENYNYFVLNDKINIEYLLAKANSINFNTEFGSLLLNKKEFMDAYMLSLKSLRTIENCMEKDFKELTIGSSKFTFSCMINQDVQDEDFEIEKKKFNDELTNLILKNIIKTDNIRTIMIYDFYVNYKELIGHYIKTTKKRTELMVLGIDLDESDIKIVLKGGSSIRLDIINYLDKIDELIKSLDDVKKINPNLLKLRYIFKLMINEIDVSKVPVNLMGTIGDYYNTFGKSDIDFNIHLNRRKFDTEEKFNIILNEIEIIAIRLLYDIREKYESNNIYSQDDVNFLNSLKDIFTKSNSDINFRYKGKQVSEILYNGNSIKYDVLTDTLDILPTTKNTKTKDQLIFRPHDFDSSMDKNIIETVLVNNLLELVNTNNQHKYRISLNKSLRKEYSEGNEIVEFDLLRIKLFTKIYFDDSSAPGDKKELDCSGELLDISFNRYRDIDVIIEPHEIKEFNFKYPLYDFSLESYTILKQIKEINKMLFRHSLNIWNVKKYNKRINRFVILLILFLMKTDPNNIGYYIKFFKTLTKLINQDIKNPSPQSGVYDYINNNTNSLIKRLLEPFKDYYRRNLDTYFKFIKLQNFCKKNNLTYQEFLTRRNYTVDNCPSTMYYLEMAKKLNVSVTISNEYINDWIVNCTLFMNTLKDKFEFMYSGMSLLNNLFMMTTEKINKINDTNVNKWGGGITYSSSNKKLLVKGAIQPYSANFGNQEYEAIDTFFKQFISNMIISFKNSPNYSYIISTQDIRNSKIINSGSFGYGLRLKATSSSSTKPNLNLVIKIIPVKTSGSGIAQINYNITTLTKESFVGYKFSLLANKNHYTYNVFNENYAIFSFYKKNKQDYLNILSDSLVLNKDTLDNLFIKNIPGTSLNTVSKQNLENGYVSFVLMNGGIADTSSIYNVTMLIKVPGVFFKNLSKCIDQLLYVHTLCYKEYEQITYLTHNDIKPGNMIYGIDESGDVYAKIIDYGLIAQSNNFFYNDGGYGTIIYKSRVLYTGVKITSPLFDLGAVLISILQNYLDVNTGKDFYVDFNLDDVYILTKPSNYIFANYQSCFKYIYEGLYYNTDVIIGDLLVDKALLTIKLLELLNIFIFIKKYYNKYIKPNENKMILENDGISNCVNYHFVSEHVEIYDIESGELIKFSGQDYDLYKQIVYYLQSKCTKIADKGLTIRTNTKYAFVNTLKNNTVVHSKMTSARNILDSYNNPVTDSFLVAKIS